MSCSSSCALLPAAQHAAAGHVFLLVPSHVCTFVTHFPLPPLLPVVPFDPRIQCSIRFDSRSTPAPVLLQLNDKKCAPCLLTRARSACFASCTALQRWSGMVVLDLLLLLLLLSFDRSVHARVCLPFRFAILHSH